MFDRPSTGDRVILVHINMGENDPESALEEFKELALSAGAEVLQSITGSRHTPHPRYFVGTGKAEEIASVARSIEAEVVMFNHALSPSQERNLEKLLQCRVLDRAGLILDIFAQRARSHEGKLQVELAQLKHLSTRLVRGWTHLERQKGGIGLRGPGETQLETDRRLLGLRIKQLNKRLQVIRKQREQGRRSRQKNDIPTVALVGYTNAGKSTLFNTLTDAVVYAADQLFATLDPTLRRLDLGNGQAVVLADTVGFVSDLPHELVEAFRATLLETMEADLLLHVIDVADEHRDAHMQDVRDVLRDIGADENSCIEVYNKIDISNLSPHIQQGADEKPESVWLSAVSGDGIDLLVDALRVHFAQSRVQGQLQLSARQAGVRSKLYAMDSIRSEKNDDQGGFLIEIDIDQRDWQRLLKHGVVQPEMLLES